MGCTAAIKARSILDNVERILAIELMAAAQGIDFRKQSLGRDAVLGRGTRGAYTLLRQHVPFIESDTVLYRYLEAVRQLLADGELLAAVDAAMT
jgi:histidine ammonia-lyase